MAIVRHVPRGPVLAVAPFNFPLNLVAHKVAPALAVGAPVIVKPASATPLSALLLGEILAETGLPEGVFSILPVRGKDMDVLVRDERLPVISFTGSTKVGWSLMEAAPRKHVVMELGSNAAAIICPDWTDLDHAAQRIATFGNYQAGQSCIAVQRVIVDRSKADEFVPKLVEAVAALKTGDPHDPEVEVGPLIDEDNARRVEEWINMATDVGARVLLGGKRTGSTVEPTGARQASGGGADPMAFDHAAHRAVLEDFIRAVQNGVAPAVTGRSALRVQQVIEAIMTSSRTGSAVALHPAAVIPVM